MIVHTGNEAKMMIAKASMGYPPSETIYDYPVQGGMVIIRKEDAKCIYMRQHGIAAIAIEGTPQEFEEMIGSIGLVKRPDVAEMIETAGYYGDKTLEE